MKIESKKKKKKEKFQKNPLTPRTQRRKIIRNTVFKQQFGQNNSVKTRLQEATHQGYSN